MKGRNPSALEKRHMADVAELGCIVCKNTLGIYSDASIHHIVGKTRLGAHYRVLPLCPRHHQVASDSGEWATRHAPGRNAGRAMFEAAYGSEESLLEQVNELLVVK